MKRGIVSLLLTLLLSACGFHLRGSIEMPKWLDDVYIISQTGDRELVSTLETQLKAYRIALNHHPEQAKYWLVIQNTQQKQEITSVGTGSNPRQYLLIYAVDFLLQKPKGKAVIPLSHVAVTRQLTVNNNRILGSNEEESLLIKEMQRDAAMQIMNKISRH